LKAEPGLVFNISILQKDCIFDAVLDKAENREFNFVIRRATKYELCDFWDPAFRSKIAQALISIDTLEPPGIIPRCPGCPRSPRCPRNPRKWCQEVPLRPHLHTHRGSGWREL